MQKENTSHKKLSPIKVILIPCGKSCVGLFPANLASVLNIQGIPTSWRMSSPMFHLGRTRSSQEVYRAGQPPRPTVQQPHAAGHADFTTGPKGRGGKVILDMPTDKAPGFDKVPISVVKNCLEHILPTLTDLINHSFSSSVFPLEWKQDEVVPHQKKVTVRWRITTVQSRYCQSSLR